jgi:hypothetical protein
VERLFAESATTAGTGKFSFLTFNGYFASSQNFGAHKTKQKGFITSCKFRNQDNYILPLTKSMLARDCYDLLLLNFSICLFVFFKIDHPCGQKKRRASVAQVVVVETI